MKPYLIDVHAHYDEKMSLSPREIVEQAKDAGVEKIVFASADLKTSKQSLGLAKQFDNVFCIIGVHPQDVETFDKETEDFLIQNGTDKKVVAIGEIGLEYCFEPYDKEKQKAVFLKQLQIAHKLQLPVQIHSREATGDMVEMLKENRNLLTNGGIVHCFNGSKETAEEYFRLGLCISVGGILTFKNAGNILDIVAWAPKDKILLETDSPYLSPEPLRGRVNVPANVQYVAKKIAKIWGVEEDVVAEITTSNALRVFKKMVQNEKC